MANELDILNNSGNYTPQSQIARRRLAEAMLKESMDPVKGNGGNVSWTQGLAKMAQAMLGGYDMYKLDQEDKDGQKKLTDFQAGSMGLPSSTPTTSTSSPMSVPGTAPAPSANTPADKKEFGLKVFDAFKKAGYSDEQAAAIAGNMAWEGAGRSDLVNPWDNIRNSPNAPHSVGIAQWNDRAPALLNFAREKGIDIPQGNMRDKGYMQDVIKRIPLETQLEFAAWEMQNTERRAGDGIRGSKTLPEAAAHAIGYHRPAGWTLNNPMAGHGYTGRLQLASDVLGAARARPAPAMDPQAAAPLAADGLPQVPGVVVEPQQLVQGYNLANAGVGMPGVAPGAPQAAPNPSQAPVSSPNLPLATPAAPPAPIAGGQQPPAAPAPNLGPSAAAPVYKGDLNAQTWAALGPRAAAVAEAVRSSDPRVRAAAMQEFQATQQRISSSMAPSDFKGQLDTALTQTRIDENKAELPKKMADARKANAEAAKVELEASTLRTPQQKYATARELLADARRLPDIYGDFAFGRALGPAVGANLAGVDDKSWNINPIQFIGKQIGDAGNYMSALTEGGAAPTEVQSAVGSYQAELGQMARKAMGLSAKEADSNVELQNFLKMVGNLGTSTSREDYYRRLDMVNKTFARLTSQDLREIPRVEVKLEQMVERAVPLHEQAKNLILSLAAKRGPVPQEPPQQQPVDDGLTPLQRAMLMGRR